MDKIIALAFLFFFVSKIYADVATHKLCVEVLCVKKDPKWVGEMRRCMEFLDTPEYPELTRKCFGSEEYYKIPSNIDRFIKYFCDHEDNKRLELFMCQEEALTTRSIDVEDWKDRIKKCSECQQDVKKRYVEEN